MQSVCKHSRCFFKILVHLLSGRTFTVGTDHLTNLYCILLSFTSNIAMQCIGQYIYHRPPCTCTSNIFIIGPLPCTYNTRHLPSFWCTFWFITVRKRWCFGNHNVVSQSVIRVTGSNMDRSRDYDCRDFETLPEVGTHIKGPLNFSLQFTVHKIKDNKTERNRCPSENIAQMSIFASLHLCWENIKI